MALDKSKPFGVIVGMPEAAYEQDGVLYDINEQPVGGETTEAPKKRGSRKQEETVNPEVEAQIAAQTEV